MGSYGFLMIRDVGLSRLAEISLVCFGGIGFSVLVFNCCKMWVFLILSPSFGLRPFWGFCL